MATTKFKPIPGPKRTPHEQDFLDLAAMQAMAALTASTQYSTSEGPIISNAHSAWDIAEKLFAERKKRL